MPGEQLDIWSIDNAQSDLFLGQMLAGLDPAAPRFTYFSHTKPSRRYPWMAQEPLPKTRVIAAPNESMRLVQKRLSLRLREQLLLRLPHATGGVPFSSPTWNAALHRGSSHFLTLDLVDAYGSVTMRHLAGLEIVHGFSETRLTPAFLQRYCFSRTGGLAQGGPASQDLFNLACTSLDMRLSMICAREGLIYSRYVDDLTFSGQAPISQALRREICAAIEAEGFRVNHLKARLSMIAKGPVEVTGILVFPDGSFSLPPAFLQSFEQKLLQAQQDRQLLQEVRGMHSYFRSVCADMHPSKKLQRLVALAERLGLHTPVLQEWVYRFPAYWISELHRRSNRVGLPALIGQYVELKPHGAHGVHKGLCLWHREKTPSFNVYHDHFHCFGCHMHGSDMLDFVQLVIPAVNSLEPFHRRFCAAVETAGSLVGLIPPRSARKPLPKPR